MPNRMRGFSLVELMVAMTLGLFVVGVVIAIFIGNSRSLRAIEQATRHVENGRYAMQLLGDDIRHAGFFAEFDASTLPTPSVKPDPCVIVPDDIKASIPLHVQGYDNSDGTLSCLSDVADSTDVLVIRRAKTCVAGTAGCDAVTNDPVYFQASQCGDDAERFALDVGSGSFPNNARDCVTAAGLREVLVHIYFISKINRDTKPIPMLMRWELGRELRLGDGIVPLVEGIERLQVEYGIDDDGDGVPNRYTANPDDPDDDSVTVRNWQNVTALRLHLLSREIDPSPGYKDEKTYTLGLDAAGDKNTVGPFDDAYRRHVYSVTVVAKNIAGRRE